jgi:hypothetical protein
VAAAGTALALALLVGACGSSSNEAGPRGPATTAHGGSSTPATGTLPGVVQSLDITGTEYVFDIEPAGGVGLRPGWTRIRFHNLGSEAHQVMFARLKDGVDLGQLAAAAGGDSSGSKAIEYVDMIGGVSYIGAGQSTEALVDLPEGTVMAMCYVPDPHGVAHALSGMSTMLNVSAATAETGPGSSGTTSGPAVAGAQATADPVVGTITMGADGYQIPASLPRGWYRVVNRDEGTAGQGLHELSILGLKEELTGEGRQRLLDELAANATPSVPLTALGGMGALSPGFEAYLYLDLEPGPYLAVDFMPDPGAPRPHLLDGYVTAFRA